MSSNVTNGKAFEYACLRAIYDKVNGNVKILTSKQLTTAEESFSSIESNEKGFLVQAASTGAKILSNLEPKLVYGDGILELSIAADAIAVGSDGDVRDVFCVRRYDGKDGWTIGISCKHNHEALRHPRITEGKDFGKDWLNIPCSKAFIEEITPITDSLVSFGKNNAQWNTIPNKLDDYYVPILSAYIREIERLCSAHPETPELLLRYFFGANDFYKVIMHSKSRTTTLIAFNMNGTLNKPADKHKAMTKIPVMTMPSRLFNAEFKQTNKGPSKTTIILTFDNGWAVSMRLHNKDKIAKPTSLAWDVKLEGIPPSAYTNTHSWDE